MCTTHALQLEGADAVGGELLRVGQGDAHHAVGLGAPGGPVLDSGTVQVYSAAQRTWSHFTLARSSSRVNITMVELRCSHTIRQ